MCIIKPKKVQRGEWFKNRDGRGFKNERYLAIGSWFYIQYYMAGKNRGVFHTESP